MNKLSSNAATEIFDRHGDLKLIVGKDNSKITFQVCSRTLARSSHVWDVMLYGPFREGVAQQQKGDEWTVSLPEDDADALRIILSIIHGTFDVLPGAPLFDLIFPLVVLSDKYDMVRSFNLFWNPWLHVWPSALENEVMQLPLSRSPARRLAQHLWLFYTLGWGDQFRSTLCDLMHRTGIGSHGRPRVTAGDSEDPKIDDLYLDSGEYLVFINADTIEDIKEARLKLLETMITKVRDVMKSLRSSSASSTVCKAQKGAAFCDRTLLGALREAMAAVNVEYWYRSRKATNDLAKTLPLSAQQMHDMLDKVISHAAGILRQRARHPRSAHKQCWPCRHLEVFNQGELPQDYNLARRYDDGLEERAKKSGLDHWVAVTPGKDDGPPIEPGGW